MTLNHYGQPVGLPVFDDVDRATPDRGPIAGHYCRLEPIDVARHADDLHASYMLTADQRDWTYLAVDRPPTLPSFRAYLQRLADSKDALHYAIVDLSAGAAVGTAALARMDPHNGSIEVGGIVFSVRMQRTAIGTEAIYLLLRRVFDELRYRRCEWKCDSLNAASCAAAERLGFNYEGTFRRHLIYKGRNRDTAWFSIIEEEWPRVRMAFGSWLDAGNFDERRRQRRSLMEIRAAQRG